MTSCGSTAVARCAVGTIAGAAAGASVAAAGAAAGVVLPLQLALILFWVLFPKRILGFFPHFRSAGSCCHPIACQMYQI